MNSQIWEDSWDYLNSVLENYISQMKKCLILLEMFGFFNEVYHYLCLQIFNKKIRKSEFNHFNLEVGDVILQDFF